MILATAGAYAGGGGGGAARLTFFSRPVDGVPGQTDGNHCHT
jgi:hypothetical protein